MCLNQEPTLLYLLLDLCLSLSRCASNAYYCPVCPHWNGNAQNSGGSERRRRRGLLGGLKKGMGVVWEKIAADHPEPLQIDKVTTSWTPRNDTKTHTHTARGSETICIARRLGPTTTAGLPVQQRAGWLAVCWPFHYMLYMLDEMSGFGSAFFGGGFRLSH